jgi:hypothetical protein
VLKHTCRPGRPIVSGWTRISIPETVRRTTLDNGSQSVEERRPESFAGNMNRPKRNKGRRRHRLPPLCLPPLSPIDDQRDRAVALVNNHDLVLRKNKPVVGQRGDTVEHEGRELVKLDIAWNLGTERQPQTQT